MNGINWRNEADKPYDAFAVLEAGQFKSVVVMSTTGSWLPIFLNQMYPGIQIIVRLFRSGNLGEPEEAVAEWSHYIQSTQHVVTLYQVDNEPNDNYPDVSPELYSHWWIRVVALLAEKFPDKLWGFPMPSIIGYDGWEYALSCSMAIRAADWIAERGYWQEDWQMADLYWGGRYELTHDTWPDKPIHLCEYGCSAGIDIAQYKQYAHNLPLYIISHNVFIMAGGTDDWKQYWITQEIAEQLKEDEVAEFKLGFKVLADKLFSEGHMVMAVDNEISINHASLQRVKIDNKPNLFAWQDGQESVIVYPLV